jgi:ActR/RegA family two-component response regulator
MTGGAAVGSNENILIVEDEDEWCQIYQRAIGSQQSDQRVEIANDLAGARQLIEATKFAVAFVDVGLDVNEDKNIDGLQVMERIRAKGDETSIIVVTGRSGQDVLKITRDAIKDYKAYDTVGKKSVTPANIRDLLAGGLQSYREAVAAERVRIQDVLRGETPAAVWDDEIMRAIQFGRGVSQFYDFLNQLFDEYLPVVNRFAGDRVRVDPSTGIAHCDYWSRAIAQGVVLCFGAAERFDQAVSAGRADGSLLGKYKIGDPLKELYVYETKGAVFSLPESKREDFHGPQVGALSKYADR